MDKEKIKTKINEVDVLTKELVADGKLDGDQRKQLLFEFAAQAIRKEIYAELPEG